MDKKSPAYWSRTCPDYKTVESFEMFIKSRETDIEYINASISDARSKMNKLLPIVKQPWYVLWNK